MKNATRTIIRSLGIFLTFAGMHSLSWADLVLNTANAYLFESGGGQFSTTVTQPLVIKKYLSNNGQTKIYVDLGKLNFRIKDLFQTKWTDISMTIGHCDLQEDLSRLPMKIYRIQGFPVTITQTYDGKTSTVQIPNIQFDAHTTAADHNGYFKAVAPAIGDRPALRLTIDLNGFGEVTELAAPVAPQTTSVPKGSPTPTGTPKR